MKKRHVWMVLLGLGLIALAQSSMPGLNRTGEYTQGTLGSILLPAPVSQTEGPVYGVGAWPLYTPDLEEGSGKDLVTAYCSVCHSTTYITMQPAMPAAYWENNVGRMINVFGATIPADDAKKIIAYLQAHYTLDTRKAETGSAVASASATTTQAPTVDGAKVYQNCIGCHQANGQGVPGAFPALAGRVPEMLAIKGGKDYLIQVLLFGLSGQISAKGQNYNGVMPSFGQLKDEEIAAVLNHVSTQWNNSLPQGVGAFTSQEVKLARAAKLSAQQVLEARTRLGIK